MKHSIFIVSIISLLVFSVFAENNNGIVNYIGEFRKNPNKDIFSTLLKAKVKTEKEADKIALNWLGKNHGLLAEEVLIVSGLYKISGSANKPNKSGYWVWEVRVTEMTMMLSGVILIDCKDGTVHGAILKKKKAHDKAVSKILDVNNNLSVEEWHKEALRLAHERDNLTINLIRLLRHGKHLNKEKKIRICFLLGEYRASRAIMDLLKIITLENKIKPGAEYRRIPLWGQYPAYEALMKIGVPAIPRILKKLETESDLMAMRLEVSIIYYVYGKEITKIILNKALSKQTDTKKAKNIKKAISLIKWSPYVRLPNKCIKLE